MARSARSGGGGREIGEGEEEEEEEEEEICLITCAAVRSLPTRSYLMVLFLWSCDLSLAISRMNFVVSVIAYLGCDWLSPLSVQDSSPSYVITCYCL